MYNYLNGVVKTISPKYIVVDVAGIGYEINVSNPYSFNLDEKMMVFTYQHVKEDEISLYGFKIQEEKNLFLDLISVKGIGPKTALLILAATNIVDFKKAVLSKDVVYLTKFPKIGKKSAQQIILDLESKFENDVTSVDKNYITQEEDEVVDALIALGYDKKAISNVLKKVDNNLSTEEKIKESLKLLIKI